MSVTAKGGHMRNSNTQIVRQRLNAGRQLQRYNGLALTPDEMANAPAIDPRATQIEMQAIPQRSEYPLKDVTESKESQLQSVIIGATVVFSVLAAAAAVFF